MKTLALLGLLAILPVGSALAAQQHVTSMTLCSKTKPSDCSPITFDQAGNFDASKALARVCRGSNREMSTCNVSEFHSEELR